MNANFCIECYGAVFKFCRIYQLLVRSCVSAVLFIAMNSTEKIKVTVQLQRDNLPRVNVRARRCVRVGKNSVRDVPFRLCVRPRNAE